VVTGEKKKSSRSPVRAEAAEPREKKKGLFGRRKGKLTELRRDRGPEVKLGGQRGQEKKKNFDGDLGSNRGPASEGEKRGDWHQKNRPRRRGKFRKGGEVLRHNRKKEAEGSLEELGWRSSLLVCPLWARSVCGSFVGGVINARAIKWKKIKENDEAQVNFVWLTCGNPKGREHWVIGRKDLSHLTGPPFISKCLKKKQSH